MLRVQREPVWRNIMALDELWFYLSPDGELNWLPRDENVRQRKQYIAQTEKFMITIV
jgi:hypothetical protein